MTMGKDEPIDLECRARSVDAAHFSTTIFIVRLKSLVLNRYK